MASQKHFLQDRTALLLVSGTAFLALISVILILLKLGNGRGSATYFMAYRPSLGIDRYVPGTTQDIWAFMVAAVLIFAVGVVMSYRSYSVKRELALTILALNIPLLLFLIVVSNALLVLR
jgi:hypothetical protein